MSDEKGKEGMSELPEVIQYDIENAENPAAQVIEKELETINRLRKKNGKPEYQNSNTENTFQLCQPKNASG